MKTLKNPGGVQFAEDFGLVLTLPGRHFSQHDAACGAERLFECLWCARSMRNVCACWRKGFFLRRSKHALASREDHGHGLDKPHFFTLTVTASLAKCKAPTCCCQLASACRPLLVAFQAASRGRELQGFSDPGGHAKEKGSVARVDGGSGSASSVHSCIHKDMCVLQSAWWRLCSEAHGVQITEEGGAWIGQLDRETVHCLLRHSRSAVMLPAGLHAPRPQGRTEKLVQGASRDRKIVSRLTHGYKIEKCVDIEQLHMIFATK